MGDMNARMRLTLENLASGPLQEFADQLKALEGVVKSLNSSLAPLGRLFRQTGEAAQAATKGVSSFSDALDTAGNTAPRLETLLQSLSAAVEALESRVGAAAAAFGEFAAGARSMGAAASTASSAVGRAGEVAERAAAGVAVLNHAYRDMLKLFAAAETYKGVKASVGAATDFQNTQTRLSNLNLPGAGASQLRAAADRTARAIPVFSREQTLSMGIDLVNATGSSEDAQRMLEPFAKAVYNMRRAMPAGTHFGERDMLLMAKALEQRGVTMDPARMQHELDVFSQIVAATQGRVGPRQLLGNINYSKGGLGLNMEDSFLPIFASLIERTGGASGGRGGQVGTALTSLQQAIVGGVIKQSALPEWGKLGLLDPSKLVFSTTGTLRGVQAGGVAGSSLFMKNPYEWVQRYLVPAMKRSGIDTTDATKVDEFLAHLFSNRNAANIAAIMATQQGLLEKDAGIINQTRTNSGQYRANQATAQANFDRFRAAVHNLAIAVGTDLLPEVTRMVQALTRAVEWLGRFANRFPTLTKYLVDFGAAIAAFLALSVFVRLASLLTGFGTAVGVAVGAASSIGAALGAVASALSGFGSWLSAAAVSLSSNFELALSRLMVGALYFHSKSLDTGEQKALAQRRALGAKDFGIEGSSWQTAKDFGLSGGWGPGTGAGAPGPAALFTPVAIHPTGGRVARHHTSMQDWAEKWRLQDLHRAARQATSESAHWSRRVQQAQQAVQNATAKDTPEGVRAKWEQYASVLEAGGHADLAAQARAVGQREATKLELHQAQSGLSDLQGELRNREKTNAALVTAGVLTKDQAQARTLADQRAAAPGLIAAARQVQALAVAAGDQGLAGKMAALVPQFQALGNGLTQFQQKIANVGQSAFEGLFSSLMKGQQTWRQMGHNFIAQILNGMNRAVSQDLSQSLVQALVGSSTSTGQALRGVGNSSGFMQSLVQGVFGTKGGATTASSTATAGGGIWAGIGSWLAGMGSSFAGGIDYVPHDMVAQIHQGEMVVPAAGAAALRSGAMGHQIHLSIHAMDSQSVLGAMDGVKRELAQMLSGANQNLNLGY